MATKRIRFTKKIKDFICEKIEEGLTIAEVCDRMYKDTMPNSKSVYREQKRDDDFYQQVTKSYELFFQRKFEELEYISNTPLDVLYPEESDVKVKMHMQRQRQKNLEWQLTKIAPMMTNRFKQQATKVEHSGEVAGPQIVIQSYATANNEEEVEDHDHS